MKSFINFLLLLPAVAWGAVEPIQRMVLDDRTLVVIPVATNRITTLSFPGPIQAMDGAGISQDPKVPALFQVLHSKGASFVSFKANEKKARTNLNIRCNKRTYAFELVECDQPIYALNLEERAVEVETVVPEVSPTRLLALLDKAKAYPILKAQHPESVAQTSVRTFHPPSTTDFQDFEIQIREIIRFGPEDTLVFHLGLTNKTTHEIRYRPDGFQVRVGDKFLTQSLSDASGILLPNSAATVYLSITGNPDGGRNDLSLKNDFRVLVSRITPPPALPAPETNALPRFPEPIRP